jgi:hypothetical protein
MLPRDRFSRNRTEERDVEYRMNFHGGRQVQAVGVCSDGLDHRKWPKAFEIQLSGWQNGPDVKGVQSYEVIRQEAWCRKSVTVGHVLVRILGEAHFRANEVVNSSQLGCGVGHYPDRGGCKRKAWMMAIMGKERAVVSGGGILVIGREFRKGQVFHPIFLPVVYVFSQVLLHGLVCPLRLSVCLRGGTMNLASWQCRDVPIASLRTERRIGARGTTLCSRGVHAGARRAG